MEAAYDRLKVSSVPDEVFRSASGSLEAIEANARDGKFLKPDEERLEELCSSLQATVEVLDALSSDLDHIQGMMKIIRYDEASRKGE